MIASIYITLTDARSLARAGLHAIACMLTMAAKTLLYFADNHQFAKLMVQVGEEEDQEDNLLILHLSLHKSPVPE